jgi:hypothetical protein
MIPEELGRLVPSLNGLECWYVSCGGSAGSTLELALGKKVPRPIPLKNIAHPEEFRHFEGEVSLFVWCAWRLDGLDSPITSWDDSDEAVETGLAKLIGARIESIDVIAPAWDANIRFSNSLCLRIFCDHVPGEPSFAGNWDLRTQQIIIAIGPGRTFRVEERASAKRR